MPFHRHLPCASTPGSKLPSARLCYLSSAFRPRGFSPPRRFAPHTGSRVCCAPQPVRVRRVSIGVGAGPVRRRWRSSETSPRGAGSHPSKSVLVDSWCRITAVRCPLVVTGARLSVTATEAAASDESRHSRTEVQRTREPRGRRPAEAGKRPAGTGRHLEYGEAPIRRERRTPTSPGHGGTGKPAAHHARTATATTPKRRSERRSSPGRSSMPAQRREGDFTSDTREHPSRAGPTAEAANHSLARPVHRGEPSGPFETTRAADYKALLRRRVRGVASPLPAIRHPILPWALFPSKVHSRSAPARSMPGPGRHRRAEARDASAQAAVEAELTPMGSLRRLPLVSPTEVG